VNIKSQVIRIFCCIVRQKKEQLSIFLFRIYWDLTFHVSLLLKKKHLIYVSVTRFDKYSLFKMRIVKFETIVSIKIQDQLSVRKIFFWLNFQFSTVLGTTWGTQNLTIWPKSPEVLI
jgi:hypothetical protein